MMYLFTIFFLLKKNKWDDEKKNNGGEGRKKWEVNSKVG